MTTRPTEKGDATPDEERVDVQRGLEQGDDGDAAALADQHRIAAEGARVMITDLKAENQNFYEARIPGKKFRTPSSWMKGFWFGTNRGLGRINPITYRVTRVNRDKVPDIRGYVFTHMGFDSNGHIWALSDKYGINWMINFQNKNEK